VDNQKSSLGKNGIITLRGWCENNGYDGVSKECLVSASQSPDPKLREMVKKERLKGIIHNEEKR